MGKQQESKQSEASKEVDARHAEEMQRRADAAQAEHEDDAASFRDVAENIDQFGRERAQTYEERQAERKHEQRRDERKMMAAHIFANVIKGQEKATKQIARDCVKHAEELLTALDEYNAAEDKAKG